MRLGAACLALALVAPPAAAQEPVHQVTGVAAADVLNVRRAPAADAPIVGAVSPLADFVLVRERRGPWARIELTRGVATPVRGWVAARYLKPSDGSASPENGSWACYGTEPFWSVWIESGEVRYQTDLGTTASPLRDVTPSRNDLGAVWRFSFGTDEHVAAVMVSGTVCSDGMSDTTLRRSLILSVGSGLLSGCCSRPRADARPPEPDPPQE